MTQDNVAKWTQACLVLCCGNAGKRGTPDSNTEDCWLVVFKFAMGTYRQVWWLVFGVLLSALFSASFAAFCVICSWSIPSRGGGGGGGGGDVLYVGDVGCDLSRRCGEFN